MKVVLDNCKMQLKKMEKAYKEEDVYSFLWGQYSLWDGYHRLSEKVKSDKVKGGDN